MFPNNSNKPSSLGPPSMDETSKVRGENFELDFGGFDGGRSGLGYWLKVV